MIEYHYETEFKLESETNFSDWISRLLQSEQAILGHLNYIFCSDDYLLKINQQYLLHSDFTDIITFDYSEGKTISGDVFISVDRVRDNAGAFGVSFSDEILRVMAHGILHLLGFGDKSEEESRMMRLKEEEKMKLFHVEQ
ncbi:rRNA maturation RNase YbeY [uncultured Kriegella sp.]|uniref:rRNA maturation RNase YbeY n=1 Tax=uncultured Kriegella sp. TaxID=1798910 RepID=UPI0030DDCD0F|tara:strand:+ start:123382 stop:123801 length:420 start_codon:yes stop_codon:yes gene_type:complete